MAWMSIADDREKYKAYLCSREWAVLRNAVRERCGGKCERCRMNAMECVHHLTYARKYEERLEDLAGWCNACHEFTHGKTEYDPLRDAGIVIPFCGTRVRYFYLAGKITGTTWRDDIVDGWSNPSQSKRKAPQCCAVATQESGYWATTEDACEVFGMPMHFRGPWWRDTADATWGHGCGSLSTMWPHGQDVVGGWTKDGEEVYPDEGGPPDGAIPYGAFSANATASALNRLQGQIHSAVGVAIDRSDLVFAWIDSLDCYGTIMEIGMAKAKGKAVAVAVHYDVPARDLWLVLQGTYTVGASSAKDGWDEFWRIVAKGIT